MAPQPRPTAKISAAMPTETNTVPAKTLHGLSACPTRITSLGAQALAFVWVLGYLRRNCGLQGRNTEEMAMQNPPAPPDGRDTSKRRKIVTPS